MRKTLILLLILCLVLILPVVTVRAQANTVADAVATRPEIGLFAEVLRRTGLDATLRGTGPYTVFAPVDTAIDSALAAAGLDRVALFADAALMQRFANAHILTVRYTRDDLRGLSLPATLATRNNGGTLIISQTGGTLRVNGGRIISADIAAGNGILHITGATSLSPQASAIPAAVAEAGESAYVRAGHFAVDLGVVDLLLDGPGGSFVLPDLAYTSQQGYQALIPGVYTLKFIVSGMPPDQPILGPFELAFAPGSAVTVLALGTLGRGTLGVAVFAEDYATLAADQARVTFYNAIEGAPALDIRSGSGLTLINGLAYRSDPVFLDLAPGNYTFLSGQTNGPPVMQTSVNVSAGTAPLVVATGTWATGAVQLSVGPAMPVPGDGQSDSGGSLLDVLADPTLTGGSRFDLLLSALDRAGLTATLRGPGPMTLFAPRDLAFAANPDLLNAPNLADVLRQHIVNNIVPIGSDPGTLTVTTGAGQSLSITVDEAGTVTVGGARVLLPAIEAANGVVYVIDGVLAP